MKEINGLLRPFGAGEMTASFDKLDRLPGGVNAVVSRVDDDGDGLAGHVATVKTIGNGALVFQTLAYADADTLIADLVKADIPESQITDTTKPTDQGS